MRVLLVEDDEMIGRTLTRTLRDESYAVDWVRDGLAATRALSGATQPYALVLLDWSLPHQSGIEVLRRMRQQHMGTPVLMLTARDAIEDRVKGLDAGADDYLVKPFSLDELRARMRSLARRVSVRPDSILACGSLRLDVITRRVEFAGRSIETTSREFALLRALLAEPHAVMSRHQLEEQIYGWGEEVASNAVEFLIHGLRRKLAPEVIENVRGAGWRIKPTP
jgi:two-component system, OmpR family, response regulator